MKTLFNISFIFVLCGLTALGISCKKNADFATDSLETPTVDDTETEELMDVLPDILDYDPEAATKISAVSGAVATAAEGSSNCDDYKYEGYFRVRTAYGNILTVTLSQGDTIDEIVHYNDEKAFYDSLYQVSPTQIRVVLRTRMDTLRVCNAKLSLKNRRGKVMSKTLKTVGQIGSKSYGHSFWIVRYERIINGTYYAPSGAVATPMTYPMDEHYIPLKGDILWFSADHYGTVMNTPVLETKTKNKVSYSQYVFKLEEMNAKCKGTITKKTIRYRPDDLENTLVSASDAFDPPALFYR